MPSRAFLEAMPKVELHVHLEGSIRPETLLKLAERNRVELPAQDVDGLREWYRFRDFPHFVEVYVSASRCIRSAEDIELIAREFAEGQKAQNIHHTEATYTARTIENYAGIPWPEQREALRRAVRYAREELGISLQFILDIVRGDPPERAVEISRWCIEAQGDPVCALGIAGIEMSTPAGVYHEAFALAREAGVPVIPHAGETKGAESVWDALEATQPSRIGHGIRCLEDPKLVDTLRESQVTLEVCPSSNVCLGAAPSWAEHPLPDLLNEGLLVTLNSDDPPMFGTTLTDELERAVRTFDLSEDVLYTLTLNAARASILPEAQKAELMATIRREFAD